MTTDFFALSQPPFDTLDKEQRERLQRHSQIVYLDSLQPIDKQWYGDFFIIIKMPVYVKRLSQ